MSRIRTIKPDFWTDGNMIGLSPYARLFYIGSWNFTICDRGHLADDAAGLRLKVLPGDDVDGVALLAELMDRGRIVRLELPDTRTFLHIPRFEDHQRIDTRWNSRCPVCSHTDSLVLTETRVSSQETPDVSPSAGGTRVGGEGKGRESKGGEAPPRRCQKHMNITTFVPNCVECRDARLAREDWDTTQKNKPTPAPPKGDITPENCNHKYVAGWCVRGCEQPEPKAEVA